MAKASGINKKLLAKKDMNFFAEFTANAARAARMLGYAVAAGILVVFVVLAFIVAFFIRNTLIKGQIRDLENLLASPDYASLEAEYAQLKEKLNDMTNYNYALTQMRKRVDLIDPVSTDLPDVIAKCIPSDSFLTDYNLTNATLDFKGYSFTYYSPVEMVYLLNEKNVFTSRPTIKTDRVEINTSSNVDEIISGKKVEAINNYYAFSVSGVLVTNVHITVTRYLDGAETTTTLGPIEILTVKAGDSYTINDVSVFTYAGVKYELVKIFVNGVQVEEGSFNTIMTNGAFTDTGRGNDEVQFFYKVVTEAPAEG